jgi:hypothetical protein
MIKREAISIKSKSGNIIDNMFLSHSEDIKNIAIIFPGGDNSTDIPILHYARKAALLCGCDVLSIKYGYNNFNEENNMNIVIEECYNLITKCLNKNYILVTHQLVKMLLILLLSNVLFLLEQMINGLAKKILKN